MTDDPNFEKEKPASTGAETGSQSVPGKHGKNYNPLGSPRKGKRKGNGSGGNGSDYLHGEKDFGGPFIPYSYPLADRTPYLLVRRMLQEKSFPIFHYEQVTQLPNLGSPGYEKNWIPGIPEGWKKVLYNLPALSQAALDAIFYIAEGEKDADTLIDLGLLGTCNMGAAAYINGKGELKGWAPELNETCKGHPIYLFEDNDWPGRTHIQTVANQLKDICPSIKVVRFRDLPEKNDVTDWAEKRAQELFGEPFKKLNSEQFATLRIELLARAEDWVSDPGAPLEPDGGNNHENKNLSDFVAYLPSHSYIYLPTGDTTWPAASVNNCLPPIVVGVDANGKQVTISASKWLDQNKSVEQMVWAPGHPALIKDKLVLNGGWIKREGATCYNNYKPPIIKPGDASKAGPWIDLMKKLYPNDAEHIIQYMACKTQRPEVKINHALRLCGAPGIGKDTLIEPLKFAVGPHNFEEVSPTNVTELFNSYAKCVVLRISEANDLGEMTRFDFYERMKTLSASPPDVLRINDKHVKQYSAFNVCGVIITSNYKVSGYLPSDDRRNFVAWSNLKIDHVPDGFWTDFWNWYLNEDGIWHVVAYLRELDISSFDPKAPPPKTQAFWEIVNANRSTETSELEDLIDHLGNPNAVTLEQFTDNVEVGFSSIIEWLKDRKNRRTIPHRLEECDYTPVRNDAAKDGLWKIKGKRQVVYAKKDMPECDRLKSVNELIVEENARK